MANTPIEGVNTSPQVLSQGPTPFKNINVNGLTLKELMNGQQVYVDANGNQFNAIASGSNYNSGNDIGQYQGQITNDGKQYQGVFDANGNFQHAYGDNFTQNGKQYGYEYNPDGTRTAVQLNTNRWTDVAPVIGMVATAFGVPGLIGSALAPTLNVAAQAALGGAVLGGGTAALTGNNILKGAALGGAGGYAGSVLGDTLKSGYDFNGPAATSPTIGDLTGSNTLTGLDQYTVEGPTASDLMGGGAGGAGSGGYDPTTNTNGYYDEITGKFVSDPNGGLQAPLDNTSGINLSSMNGYNYDPASGTWTMPDGTQVATTPGNPYKSTSGADILKSAGAAGAGLADKVAAAGTGGILGSLGTGSTLGDAALINGGASLVNGVLTKTAISDALNNTTNAANTSNATLKDIYNSQLGMVKPYQDLGVGAVNAIMNNGDYFQHQFDATDLQKGLAPNYDFMLQQGQMGNQRAANVGGGAIGGNALQGLNQFTQDYAKNAYQNAFNNYQTQRNNIYNNLSNAAGIGNTANSQIIAAGNNYGQNTTNLATGLAAAQAGATVGQNQNTTNLIGNLANNVTLASLLNQKSSVG